MFLHVLRLVYASSRKSSISEFDLRERDSAPCLSGDSINPSITPILPSIYSLCSCSEIGLRELTQVGEL